MRALLHCSAISNLSGGLLMTAALGAKPKPALEAIVVCVLLNAD